MRRRSDKVQEFKDLFIVHIETYTIVFRIEMRMQRMQKFELLRIKNYTLFLID